MNSTEENKLTKSTILKLNNKKFSLIEEFSHGHASQIFLVKDSKGKIFKLKKEKAKSTRINMVQKEASNLKKANSIGVGPKLIDFNESEHWVLMEFIKGKLFCDFISNEPSKKELLKVLNALFQQAKKLDEIDLDHGQLAGRGANILVTPQLKPVIIDFEKASQKRKPHNLNVLKSMLFIRNSEMGITVRSILGEKELEKLSKF
ncbi:MAG: RIO1 family regulatory kinase/ATPase [Candidatus Diapherotrites archaeon]